MDNRLISKLLPSIIHSNGQAQIAVTGISMQPTLQEEDIVTIKPCTTYEIGDILVYPYKDEGLLIHRLLRKDSRCYCKGDNAFRLEDIPPESIIGKVVSVNTHPLAPWPAWKIALSYAVNRQFFRCHYNILSTKQTDIYKLYADLILRKGDHNTMYKKNTKMDFIPADDTSLAVFDPDTGTTYFFDETGIDILNTLDEPCNIEELLERLCHIYDASPEEIRPDVEEFLADTVQKKVVEMV